MPVLLIQQLAEAIAALHRNGRAWLAVGGSASDVCAVHCIHTAEGYFARTSDAVLCRDTVGGNGQGILLLGHGELHLSWIGAVRALAPQDKGHASLLARIRRETGATAYGNGACLVQLMPQYGRFSCRGQDVSLHHDALDMILNMRAAA